ncbi:MAG TPA: hypothetical protein VGG85_13830 [Terracidiphilus sp.]
MALKLPYTGRVASSLEGTMAMFRLDYLSCFLTVVATVLVARKMWSGLLVSGINSLIVCVIGVHTSQYGFIPANVFCICIYAFNLRSWVKARKDQSESSEAKSEPVACNRRTSNSGRVAAGVSIRNAARITLPQAPLDRRPFLVSQALHPHVSPSASTPFFPQSPTVSINL